MNGRYSNAASGTAATPHGGNVASLREQLAAVIDNLPADRVTLGELLDTFGDEGLLLLTILLTLVFLIPVSIPGVSTVFGAAILLVGISRLIGKPLWLPNRIRHKSLPADKLRPGLQAGMRWVQRMERISRPHRLPALADGRGIGLVNKLRAYRLQEGGLDTLDANLALGLPADAREYLAAAMILKDLGIERVRLLTNNPAKIAQLEQHGVEVVERVPLVVGVGEIAGRYLDVKRTRMGHLLDDGAPSLTALPTERNAS